jgi:hypothetical protein
MHPHIRELLELDPTIGGWALFGSGPFDTAEMIDGAP